MFNQLTQIRSICPREQPILLIDLFLVLHHSVEANEVGRVVFPANPKAAVTGTKSRWDVCDCETKNDLHEEACPRFMGKTDRILITMQSDLASLLKGPEAKKTDSDSLFADIEANLAKINTQLKGA